MILNHRGEPIASKPPTRSLGFRRAEPARARYDAAQTTDENRRHWANADGYSAERLNSPEVRRYLRNRARYETANNSYARGITLTLANDTIGTGPRLQMLLATPELNTAIEAEFRRWAKAVGLAAKLRQVRLARADSGEAFLLLRTNRRLHTPVTLDLVVREAEEVSTPALVPLGTRAIDGIVFDEFGNPVEYHVLREHPGGMTGLVLQEYDREPAENVIHYFRAERPGQRRGIPEITPALPLFAQLRRYTLAVLSAAESAANMAGLAYTDAPPDGEADEVEPLESIELERNMLTTLPAGWKFEQMKAEQPTNSYKDFKNEIINEIARCLNMPFNVAACNSASYNYASGRLDHQVYYKSIRTDQQQVEDVILDRIFAAWMDEAVLIPGYLPGLPAVAEWPHQWFWDGADHVDPLKEASATESRLRTHTTTLAHEYARRGLDWETQLRQRAKELGLMAELGMPLVTPNGTPLTPTGTPGETDADGEE